MYDAVEDPYCYPGTTVLRNRAGLTDQDALDAFELDMTTQRASEPLPPGCLGVRHTMTIHRHLFGDVYPWAGKRRTVRIAKDSSASACPEDIDREMARLFGWLRQRRHLQELPAADFARDAAHFLAELNAIHPFREGNGRTSLAPWRCSPHRQGTRCAWSGWNRTRCSGQPSRASMAGTPDLRR